MTTAKDTTAAIDALEAELDRLWPDRINGGTTTLLVVPGTYPEGDPDEWDDRPFVADALRRCLCVLIDGDASQASAHRPEDLGALAEALSHIEPAPDDTEAPYSAEDWRIVSEFAVMEED